MREGNNLEQFAHCGAIVPDQAGERLIDISGMRGLGFEGGRALFDTEPPQKLRLVDGPEAGNPHGLDRPYQRLEIHVRGEVEFVSGSAKACWPTACKVSPRPLSIWP